MSSTGQTIGSPSATPANIFFFIALGIGVVLVNIFAVAAIRHYIRKRHSQNISHMHGADRSVAVGLTYQARDYGPGGGGTYPYSLGANGSRRGRVARNKKPLKLMTRAQIDSQFPVVKFREAKAKSPLYSKHAVQGEVMDEKTTNTTVTTCSEVTFLEKSTLTASKSQEQYEPSMELAKQHIFHHHRNLNLKSKHQSLMLKKEPQHSIIASLKNLGSESNLHSDKSIKTTPSGPFRHSLIDFNNENSDYIDFVRASANKSRYSTPVFGTDYRRYPKESIDDDTTSLASEIEDNSEDEEHIVPGDENDLSTCAICIEDMEDNDDVRGLSCGHIFHAECIEPWLLTRRACCPLCKKDFYAPNTIDPLGPDPVEEVPQPQRASRRVTTSNRQSSSRRRYGLGSSSATTTTTVQVIGESQPHLSHFRSTNSLASSMLSLNRLFPGRGSQRNNSSNTRNDDNAEYHNNQTNTNNEGQSAYEATSNPFSNSVQQTSPANRLDSTPRQLEEANPRYPETAAIR